MARYINAERLKDSMFAYYDCLDESAKGRPYKGDTLMDYEVVDMIEDCIDNAPTVDIEEVKHGENIGTLHPVDEFICSECGIVLEGWTKVVTDEDDGEMYFYEYEFKYCPNCGAKMDGCGRE